MLLKETKNLIEALFFIRGEDGINIRYLKEILEIEENEAYNMLELFKEEYNSENTALIIKKFGDNYKMLVEDSIFLRIKESSVRKNLLKLSKASLETLAIIAYNQPITKVEINKLRGVNSDSIINSLQDKELIIARKSNEILGKPNVYETTEIFLDIFGLESLENLPEAFKNDNEKQELENFLKD